MPGKRQGVILLCLIAAAAALVFAPLPLCRAEDWPTYRSDNTRSGAGATTVTPPLRLAWSYFPLYPPKPAWPLPAEELPRCHGDNAFHVCLAEGLVYFGSSADGMVYALDLERGTLRWQFSTEGPVRYAPAYAGGRLYFGSDDGHVYCLRAATGELLWKHRPGPSSDRIIGNGRLVSIWPVRTSVLLDGAEVFFGAGVFPFEGISIGCLNANDGSVIWQNDTVGDHSHNLEFGGISPQGYLVASKEVLYVPSGRAMPAAFDRRTGKLLFYASPGAKRGGTWALLDEGRLLAGIDHSGRVEKIVYDASSGRRQGAAYAWFPGIDMTVSGTRSFVLTGEGVVAIDRSAYDTAVTRADGATARQRELQSRLSALRKSRDEATAGARVADGDGDAHGDAGKGHGVDLAAIDREIDTLVGEIRDLEGAAREARTSSCLWRLAQENLCTIVKAGNVLIAGGEGFVIAVDAGSGRQLWTGTIEGRALGLAAVDNRLVVSSDAGPIYCFKDRSFAGRQRITQNVDDQPFGDDTLQRRYRAAAAKIVADTGITKGFCLIPGCGDGRLALELVRITDLHVAALERDPALRVQAREKLTAAGQIGERVVVAAWPLASLPPYFANLIVHDRLAVPAAGTAPELEWEQEELARLLRPCGGTRLTCAWDERAERVSLQERQVRGPLEGAAGWTHLYGNTQNTSCSGDELVKGPFGVLWYGEPGPLRIVERHARACAPVSLGGRVFHQGEEVIWAYDAYNGAFLWEQEIPGAVRTRVDVDGGNLALTANGLFIAAHDRCYRLDPATGEVLKVYPLPAIDGQNAGGDLSGNDRGEGESSGDPTPPAPGRWGYLAATDEILYGTIAAPLRLEYAAAWKDFVDDEQERWKTPSELAGDVALRMAENQGHRGVYEDFQERYPQPGEDLYMEFHRLGTFWRPMTFFPDWGSERSPRGALTERLMAGDVLFALDVDTGEVLWSHHGPSIPNIAVTLDSDTIFFVEGRPTGEERAAAQSARDELVAAGIHETGTEAETVPPEETDVRRVVALDALTGHEKWRKLLDLTGCGGDRMGAAYAGGVLLFFGHFSNHDTSLFLGHALRWRRVTALDAASGEVLWSRPLNYLRRPLVVGDTLIIEPRTCDLRTGEVKMRRHPISGQPVPFEFLRPGHCCGVTSAAANTIFYRSYWAAIYELAGDRGLSLFGAIRPGCWLNMIAANGLMLMPEASSGCTCSFPVRCSLALAHRPRKELDNWTVFIAHGASIPLRHLSVNFGAHGDVRNREDPDSHLWLAWPRPKVVSNIGYGNYAMPVTLDVELLPGGGFFQDSWRGVRKVVADSNDKFWLFTSGCRGIKSLEVPLTEGLPAHRVPGTYTVRLGFRSEPEDRPGSRVFDVAIQEEVVIEGLDVAREAGGGDRALVKELSGVAAGERLTIGFFTGGEAVSDSGSGAAPGVVVDRSNWPVLCFVQVLREDLEHLPGQVFGQPLRGPFSAEDILVEASRVLELHGEKYQQSALERFHLVFESDAEPVLKLRALQGMASIKSALSLPVFERCWESHYSIMNDYSPIDPAVLSASVGAFFEVASALGGADKRRADRLLEVLRPLLAGLDDVELRREALERLGYIVRWRLLGPVPWGAGCASVRDVYLQGVAVEPGQPVEVAGETLHWQDFESARIKIDLQAVLGVHDRVSAYLAAEVDLEEPCRLAIKVGSDDGFKCWFNGAEAGGFDGPRGFSADQTVLHVDGKKGRNILLLQVIEQGGSWAFSARVVKDS